MMELTEYQRKQLEMKYELVQDALRKNGNNKTQAARFLGIDRRTLHNILSQYSKLDKAA